MIWTDIKRIFKAGFVSFWRNAFVSLSSILIMTLSLFVIGSLIFLGAMLDTSLTQLKDKVDINVYFLTNAPEEEILDLKTQIEELPEVEYVEYVNKEEVLVEFRLRHENDQLILQSLEELGYNPFGANLNVKAKEISQYEGIAKFLAPTSFITPISSLAIKIARRIVFRVIVTDIIMKIKARANEMVSKESITLFRVSIETLFFS